MILRGSRSSSQPPSRLTASVIEQLLIATLIAVAIVTAIGTIRHSLPGVGLDQSGAWSSTRR